MFEIDGKNLMFEGLFVEDSEGDSIFIPSNDVAELSTLEESPCFVNEG